MCVCVCVLCVCCSVLLGVYLCAFANFFACTHWRVTVVCCCFDCFICNTMKHKHTHTHTHTHTPNAVKKLERARSWSCASAFVGKTYRARDVGSLFSLSAHTYIHSLSHSHTRTHTHTHTHTHQASVCCTRVTFLNLLMLPESHCDHCVCL